MKKKNAKNSKKMITNNSRATIDKMKYEIANEFGVNLGADCTSRSNGAVGGEITRRLVENGRRSSNSNSKSNSKSNNKSTNKRSK